MPADLRRAYREPTLVLQMSYKAIYLVAVGLPLELDGSGQETSIFFIFLVPVVFELAVIPWRYAFARFVKAPGDPWSASRQFPEGEPSVPSGSRA